MSQQPRTISVNLMGKDYLVACPEEAEHDLREAAQYLDSKMQEIRASGRIIGSEKVAVMAALNIAYEMNARREADASATRQKLTDLTQLITQTLDQDRLSSDE